MMATVWDTLSWLVGDTVFTFISVCFGATKNTAGYVLVDIAVFVVFTPTGSPYPPASLGKLAVGSVGHSPGKQSAPLGRATAGGVISVRISQAQVRLRVRRDSDMVKEFAMNIER